MKGRRTTLSKLKLASVFVLRRLFPHRNSLAKPQQKISKFKVLNDIYRDYKALRTPYPLSQNTLLRVPSRFKKQILRNVKMSNSSTSDSNSNPPSRSLSSSPLEIGPPASASSVSATQLGRVSPSPQASSSASTGYISRRQRLLGFAKTTRDTYIPRFAGSVSQIASGVSKQVYGVNDLYDYQGNLVLPKDSSITLFPSYTRKTTSEDDSYVIEVKGWLSCPGQMTRKNRLILSLAKQITKYGANNASTENAISKLESDKLKHDVVEDHKSDPSDLNSSASSDDLSISSTFIDSPNTEINNNHQDELIKERLRAFIARSIAGAELNIIIGSESKVDQDNIKSFKVVTDVNGHFEADIEVSYKPSIVQVQACSDETIFSFQDIMFIPHDGLGVISDIDDTIKLTGVIGDKRQLMTSLLLHDVFSWNIPPVVKWYTQLYHDLNLSFHYVSNSPWQLFSVIDKYFKAVKLPIGSVHLKQYTGNIISSLMEPSSSRKKRALYKILEDFPKKKFICVGDSGEHDLEAYTDLAAAYPNKVTHIYIRYVKDSLSDIDDARILQEVRRMTNERKKIKSLRQKQNPSVKESSEKPAASAIEDLIDLTDLTPSPPSTLDPKAADRKAKLPPMIPSKPKSFQGSKIARKPPLPERDSSISPPSSLSKSSTPSSISTGQKSNAPKPPLPRKTVTNAELNSKLSSQNNSIDNVSESKAALDEECPPPLPSRTTGAIALDSRRSSGEFDVFDNLHNVYHFHNYDEVELMDSRGAQWLVRVAESLDRLKYTDTDIHFFQDDDDDFFKDALELVSKNLQE